MGVIVTPAGVTAAGSDKNRVQVTNRGHVEVWPFDPNRDITGIT